MSNLVTFDSKPVASEFDDVFATITQAAVGGISSGGFNRLKLQNGRFVIVRPDGDEMLKYLEVDIVVVDAIPNLVRKFYAGSYKGDQEAVAPDCQSSNGKTPTGGDNRQCETCADCPQNVWGTSRGADGKLGQGKACSERKQLAVYLHETREVLGLEVPPTSLKNFQAYVTLLNNHGRMLPKSITRLGTEIRKESGSAMLTFSFGGDLGAKEIATVAELYQSPEVKRITHPEEGLSLPAPNAKPALEAPKTAPKAAEVVEEDDIPPPPKRAPKKAQEQEEVQAPPKQTQSVQKETTTQEAFFDDDDDELARELDL